MDSENCVLTCLFEQGMSLRVEQATFSSDSAEQMFGSELMQALEMLLTLHEPVTDSQV